MSQPKSLYALVELFKAQAFDVDGTWCAEQLEAQLRKWDAEIEQMELKGDISETSFKAILGLPAAEK
jgi:acetolactate synthase small subunit